MARQGGAIVSPDAKTKVRIDHLKNLGFAGETTVVAPGINGKMSEFNAAFGLLQLKHVVVAITRRQAIDRRYREGLRSVRGIRCLESGGNEHSNVEPRERRQSHLADRLAVISGRS